MKNFSEVQVTLDRAPHVYAGEGRYFVSFLVNDSTGQVPTITLLPVDPAQPILSAVVRPEILSLALERDARRLSIFPDGRFLFRGEDDRLFQDIPGRKGAQISHGGTSVTIGPNGEVIVLAPGYSMLIDRSGVATLLDPAEGAAASAARSGGSGDDGAPGDNVIPLRD